MKNYKNFQKYFQSKILNVKKLCSKGNNQLFVITLNDKKYLLKKYSGIHMDNWKRGETEFKALNYLWGKNFREIPQPINFYEQKNIAIYSFEEGKILEPKKIKEKNILKAVDFLLKVHSLEDKSVFGLASSACLCLQDYIDVIDRRFEIIKKYKPSGPKGGEIKEFLDKCVIPKISKLKKDFYNKSQNLNLNKELSLTHQVLTPADFGFHNILVNKNGEPKYLDFEYFGRDDPARQILDFMHHAQSQDIKKELKILFFDEYKSKSNNYELEERVNLLDPLIRMTWVLIYLNVLSKNYIEHVKFAHGNIGNIIEERFHKAEKKLEEIV